MTEVPENALRAPGLFDTNAVPAALGPHAVLREFRDALERCRDWLVARFEAGEPAHLLIEAHARNMDQVLLRAWRHLVAGHVEDIALVAVGGYGRGELHPFSDIDLLILRATPSPAPGETHVEHFVRFLWDIGLEVGHSVRTPAECRSQAERDVTVATNLMEARLLDGCANLYEEMCELTDASRIWPSRDFFTAKWVEQQRRHARFHDTAHNLEPNVKEGPGALRDIQTIAWVARRHFGAPALFDLVTHGFLTADEHAELREAQHFLWQIRFALHLHTGRCDDRLLFDYQLALARQFGYVDEPHRLGVEQLMKRYYRTLMALGRLNEMLLELFQEAILHAGHATAIESVNERFQARNGFLEVARADVFRRTPQALIEMFLILQQRPDLKGVRATTIRLVREHRHLIDDSFRADPRVQSMFLRLFRQGNGLTHELRRMHRYGVLAAYLPAFADIEGQMHYDLFHAYTVDEHSLFVVRNLRRFAVPDHGHEFPFCSALIARAPKPEVLYLAGLFHDIAKGRGADHSVLGAAEACAFCRRHGMSAYDTGTVAWLVSHHLLMSVTAQRRDITDPRVISAFAAEVGDQLHLDYLYLLTIADIRATNPNLWNDWKNTLLRDLYDATQRALARGLENPVARAEVIRERLQEARRIVLDRGLAAPRIEPLWQSLDEGYFLRADPEEIAWHTLEIAGATSESLPLVRCRHRRGGTEVLVYTPDQERLFATIVATLDRLALNILDARITTTSQGMALDSFVVLELDGSAVTNCRREHEVAAGLRGALRSGRAARALGRRRGKRHLAHFSLPTQVSFDTDELNQRTMMEIVTTDRPGLLARIGQALVEAGVSLQTAKIATFGERVEDMFHVTDHAGGALDAGARDALREQVIAALDDA